MFILFITYPIGQPLHSCDKDLWPKQEFRLHILRTKQMNENTK